MNNKQQALWDEAFDEGYEAGLEALVGDLHRDLQEGDLRSLGSFLESLGARNIRWERQQDRFDYSLDNHTALRSLMGPTSVTLTLELGL